jgi:hypothetical protein
MHVTEVRTLLGRYAVSPGKQLPTFRSTWMSAFSASSSPIRTWRWRRNCLYKSQSLFARESHRRKTESSAPSLRQAHISHVLFQFLSLLTQSKATRLVLINSLCPFTELM